MWHDDMHYVHVDDLAAHLTSRGYTVRPPARRWQGCLVGTVFLFVGVPLLLTACVILAAILR